MEWIIKIIEAVLAWFQSAHPPVVPQVEPVVPTPPPAVSTPVKPRETPVAGPPIDTLGPWDTPENCRQNVRVLCDLSGLSLANKNIITACVQVESGWQNYLPDGRPVTHRNLNKDGSLASTDFGICQINDFYHIGPGKDFPSVQYVLDNPQKAVQFMIDMFKAGKLDLWVSYSSGAYKKYL